MVVTDPAADELIYARVFSAPRDVVFRCMTERERLTHFWGPKGTTTPVDGITIDLRPGGIFETTMIGPDGSQYTMTATYLTVVPPELLVWVESNTGVTTSTTFTDLGASRTEVEIRQSNVPLAFQTTENRAGFTTSLDRFADYLASLANEGA
jgi:uncharacterized protein YndB with AHSA1/START domain